MLFRSRLVWGSSLVGGLDGTQVIWGDRLVWSDLSADRIVWSDLTSLSIGSAAILGGNLDRANRDLR